MPTEEMAQVDSIQPTKETVDVLQAALDSVTEERNRLRDEQDCRLQLATAQADLAECQQQLQTQREISAGQVGRIQELEGAFVRLSNTIREIRQALGIG